MKISALYSFDNGQQVIELKYGHLLSELIEIIKSINADGTKDKATEKYNVKMLRDMFKNKLENQGWHKYQVNCENFSKFYTSEYETKSNDSFIKACRSINFVKEKLAVETYFGKFPINSIEAQMIIFKNFGIIDTGIGILPIRQFADDMSTGVSYFEQFVWDLEKRGVSNIDVPVMIIGVDAN